MDVPRFGLLSTWDTHAEEEEAVKDETLEEWWDKNKKGLELFSTHADFKKCWQAALAHGRELMICGHPRAHARPHLILGPKADDGELTTYCLACEAVAKSREEALLALESLAKKWRDGATVASTQKFSDIAYELTRTAHELEVEIHRLRGGK